LAVVGAVHPDGIVIVACEPARYELAGAVKVKVKLLLVVPPVTVVGFTTMVPSPLPATIVNVAERLTEPCLAVTVCAPAVLGGTEKVHVPWMLPPLFVEHVVKGVTKSSSQ
jgi:hypothetical protein